jgi:anaphase-promoting complex subunit 6
VSLGLLSRVAANLSSLDDPNDAFWLAQTYFMTHQYARAFRLLTRPFPTTPNAFDPSRAAAAPSSSTQPTQTNSQPSQTNSTPFPSYNSQNQTQPPYVSPHKGKAKLISQTAERSVVSIPRLPMGSAGLVDVPEPLQDHTSRLVDLSLACRYLAAQCMLRSGKWNEAMELIGEDNPFAGSCESTSTVPV